MKLSDLLGSTIVDESGATVGKVHDVRLVQQGPLIGQFGAAFRVEGLIAGPRSIGSRLGLGRNEVRGPWIVKAVLTSLSGELKYVKWERIRAISERVIHISGSVSELSAPETLDLSVPGE